MFLIHCPHCGEAREEEEFHASGQAHIARPADPDSCTDREWGDYLYFRDNPKGLHRELWVHAAGCRKYFNILRDTASYRILASYRCGETAPADVAPDHANELATKLDNDDAYDDATDQASIEASEAAPRVSGSAGHAQSARSAKKHAHTDPDSARRGRHSAHSAGQGVDKLVAASRRLTTSPKPRKEK